MGSFVLNKNPKSKKDNLKKKKKIVKAKLKSKSMNYENKTLHVINEIVKDFFFFFGIKF